ncbi:bifunctional nuclease family protein [bacterium]|nr:bifunctional nuclease family protein [bacterium]
MIEVKVAGIAMDASNMPIIILKDEHGKRVLPIWVGLFEAQAILFALEGIVSSRPLTHDLLKTIIETTGVVIQGIVINAIQDNTYFAKIEVRVNGHFKEIDCRPSDAIALALRTSSPIYVSDPVLSMATMPQTPIDDNEVQAFKDMLKDLKPKDISLL